MKASKIKPEDILLLKELLHLKGEMIVFDPENTLLDSDLCTAKDISTLLKNAPQKDVCINLSNESLELVPFDFILEFNSAIRKYKSFFREAFLSINNPDGTIRWFIPDSSNYPSFLNLYNGSGLKAALFSVASRVAFYLGLKRWICRGGFSLYAKKENHFKQYFASEELAVFTGTIGENRKAVAALCKKGKATHFVKIPISKNARKLIDTEKKHLDEVNKFDLATLHVPSAEMINTGLKLTNICPKETLAAVNITDVHLNGLKHLYSNSAEVKVFENVPCFMKIQKRLENIKKLKREKIGSVAERKVERLSYNLKVLFNSFERKELVGVAYAHGDFTPWNMFVSSNGIYVYDWELAMPEQLFLYDAFHFIFQSSILILHQPYKQISYKVNNLKKNPIVVDILERYNQDFDACYQWYLVNNCSYYLEIYMRQAVLHKQADWLIDAWIDATNDMIKSTKPAKIMVS